MNTILMFRRFTTARMILLGPLCVLLTAFVSIHPAFGQLTDTTPPVLTSFDFTPKSVDVTSGDATVTVNLHVTDDLSGFSSAFVSFYSPSRGQERAAYAYLILGTPLNAEAQDTLTMPQFSEAGNWVVGEILLFDRVGNFQELDTAALASLGFLTTLAVISNQDVMPPQLNSFNFVPSAIDVSLGPQSITFTLGLTDSPAGLDFSFCTPLCYDMIQLDSPSGKQTQVEAPWNFTQVSGTPQNGVWQVTVTLPQYAEAGLWKVRSVILHDRAHNYAFIDTLSLQSRGFATTFTVASSPSDTTPPQLTSLAFTPTFVDTTAGSKTITLTIGASDNLAGANPRTFEFVSPSGNQNLFLFSETLVAGTPANGTWQATARLPQYSEAGTWRLDYAYLRDAAGNAVTFNNAQLKAMGLPTELEVILPSRIPDGRISDPATGGTVQDTVFGERAQLVVPPGVLTQPTQVTLDVLSSDLNLPIPAGFSTTGTNYVNIKLDPEPIPPFPVPGLTLVLPVSNQTAPGTSLTLFRVDPVSGNLTPEPSVTGGLVVGTVNSDGLSATFTGVASLSTVVGLVPTGAVLGDLDGDGQVNCADIAIVRNAFGKRLGQPGFDSRADTNQDNVVNVRDLSFVSRHLPTGVVCRITPTGAISVSPTGSSPVNKGGINP